MANIMERISADNKTTFTARIRIKGYRQQTATFPRITDARLWVQKTESLMREGKYFSQAEAKRHTFADMTERYIKTVLPNKSAKVGFQYAQQLRKWSSWLGALSLDKITTALIVEYRDKLALEKTTRGGCKSAATVNRYLAALSSAYSVAIKEWQWVEENPVKKIGKFKEKKGRERFLSPVEIELLLKTCLESGKKDLYLAIVLALSTGARQMETWSLCWKDIDLDTGKAIIRETKNKQTRVIPIQSYALELMRKKSKVRRIDTDLVFPSTVDPQKPFDFRKSWESVLREAEIKDFRWHDLRHSAGSYLAMNGASLRDIAEILGHKTLEMAMRYSHLTDAHSAGVVKSMNEKMFENY